MILCDPYEGEYSTDHFACSFSDKEVTERTVKSLSYNDLLTKLSEKKSIALIMVTQIP